MENYQQTHSILFVVILGTAFSAGVFLSGWLAIKWQWLKVKPKILPRLFGTLIGSFLPLILAQTLYPMLEPGNPFFLVSMLTSILGFFIPGWIDRSS
jgi:hypothetical protein